MTDRHAQRAGADQRHGSHSGSSLNRVAFLATVHCLTGCAIGEVVGMSIGTALGWGDYQTIVVAMCSPSSSATH